MKHEQILTKAIERAVANGWDAGEWFFNEHGKLCNFDMEAGYIGLPENAEYGIIYAHDFAKALWGESFTTDTQDYYASENGAIYMWQFHLQRMVIADDPIEYLGEHLD